MSLKTFEIKLDNPTATYGAGAIITGQVVIDLTKTKELRALKLRFKGKCSVYWKKSNSSTNSSRTLHYKGEEEYFRNDVCLFGSTGGDTVEMLAGCHYYPFSYALPRNIPSSFEHGIGSVEYSIKAIIDRPWKFDHETTKVFTVETPFELNPQSYSMAGIRDEEEEDYCCILPCISRGNMTFTFELPTTGYACGEPIRTTVYINNRSDSVEVEEIELKLEQKLKFHARSPHEKTKTQSCVVQQSKQSGPFLKKSEVLVGLQVPTVPLSKLQYCSLIDISYQIHVEVHVSGLHCKTEKFYDILIGTRPPAMAHQVHLPVPNQYPLQIASPSAPVDYPSAYDRVSASPTVVISGPVLSQPQREKNPPYPQFPIPGAPYPTQSGSSQYPPPGAPYPTQLGSGQYPPPGVPYPTESGPDLYPPNNAPYPNDHPFQYPSAPGFQPPRNVEFVPSNPTSPFQYPPEQLPPSYDSVISNDNRK